MINIKEMATEEIKSLIEELKTELKSREEEKPQLVVYRHGCYGASKYHWNKYKHWCKLVTDVDDTKADGYALIGDFLNSYGENMLPKGAVVVEVCGTAYTASRVTGDYETEEIATGSRGALHEMIVAVKAALKD